jgi:hypothetical protein
MKHFKFIMDDGYVFDIVSTDFRAACITFDQCGGNPRLIAAIEER